MTEFQALFGIRSAQVKRNCILLPVVQKEMLDEFKIKNFSKGRLYQAANTRDFTLINTRISPGFVGDAVLYLKETPCRNLILFGSCGLVKEKDGFSIGSLVSPSKCYSNESFTEMLLGRNSKPRAFYPHKGFFESFLRTSQKLGVRKVSCSTISSLRLEPDLLDSFIEKAIDVVDMECSAFFSASNYTGLEAVALFYVSDIIKKKPFYKTLEPVLKTKLSTAIEKSSHLLGTFFLHSSH
jgi:hypothetical protein